MLAAATADAEKGDAAAPPVLDVALDYTLADYSHQYRVTTMGKDYGWAVLLYAFFIGGLGWGAIKAFLAHDIVRGIACFIVALPFVFIASLPWYTPRQWYNRSRSRPHRLLISEAGVKLTAPNVEVTYHWNYFTVGWEDAQMLVFGNAVDVSYLIPRRFFNGDTEREAALHALLLRHIPSWTDLRTAPTGSLKSNLQRAKKEQAR